MLEQLRALTCFTDIDTIAPITAGLSSRCYQVNADNKVFFAKSTTTDETEVTLMAAEQGVSPKVIYHDQHWLISQFMTGDNLAQSPKNINANIAIAIKLMTQCHQLNAKPSELSPSAIINDLINNAHFSTQQKHDYLHIAESILPPLNHSSPLACCHGDVNFSNILIDQQQNAWLVDYECVCTAPIEYDLAMFIAVNNIVKGKIPTIIKQYIMEQNISEQDKKHSLAIIEPALLQHYLMFCYFINGLWYFNQYHNDSLNSKKLLSLAKQQWQSFNEINKKIESLTLPKL